MDNNLFSLRNIFNKINFIEDSIDKEHTNILNKISSKTIFKLDLDNTLFDYKTYDFLTRDINDYNDFTEDYLYRNIQIQFYEENNPNKKRQQNVLLLELWEFLRRKEELLPNIIKNINNDIQEYLPIIFKYNQIDNFQEILYKDLKSTLSNKHNNLYLYLTHKSFNKIINKEIYKTDNFEKYFNQYKNIIYLPFLTKNIHEANFQKQFDFFVQNNLSLKDHPFINNINIFLINHHSHNINSIQQLSNNISGAEKPVYLSIKSNKIYFSRSNKNTLQESSININLHEHYFINNFKKHDLYENFGVYIRSEILDKINNELNKAILESSNNPLLAETIKIFKSNIEKYYLTNNISNLKSKHITKRI